MRHQHNLMHASVLIIVDVVTTGTGSRQFQRFVRPPLTRLALTPMHSSQIARMTVTAATTAAAAVED
jgi:hypothetical protein